MTERLRLFPLQMVLFPGMPLSLQVFEDRYRTLVAECIEAGEPFGVALIREGAEVGGPAVPFTMGTTARIRRVSPARDGRILLEARGVRRFRTTELFDDRPYLSAHVEYPVDEDTDVPPLAMEEVLHHYKQLERLKDTIAGEYHRVARVPEAPGALADAVGAAARGHIGDRRLQRLLETLSVSKRLDASAELMVTIISATHQQAAAVVAQRWAAVERRN